MNREFVETFANDDVWHPLLYHYIRLSKRFNNGCTPIKILRFAVERLEGEGFKVKNGKIDTSKVKNIQSYRKLLSLLVSDPCGWMKPALID